MAPRSYEAKRYMTTTLPAKESMQKHGSRRTGSVYLSTLGKARRARNPAGNPCF